MQILRDIFTFGLGELGDWGGLNAQIDYANKLIQSCQNDLNTCQAALREAEQAISKIDSEIAQYSQLQTSLNAYLPRLRELKQQADDLRQRNQDWILERLSGQRRGSPSRIDRSGLRSACCSVDPLGGSEGVLGCEEAEAQQRRPSGSGKIDRCVVYGARANTKQIYDFLDEYQRGKDGDDEGKPGWLY
jgi:hypothetical protein